MYIKNSNAAKLFFSNSSLQYVYFEAIANSIDANATEISVDIKINSFAQPKTLQINITDNGDGFTDKNFAKFSRVLDVDAEDKQHKGVGRLVFLYYFKKIDIESHYETNKRNFTFNDSFVDNSHKEKVTASKNITRLSFSGYKLDTIKTYDYINPRKLLEAIIYHFLPKLYSLKRAEKKLRISISLETREENLGHQFRNDSIDFSLEELKPLKEMRVNDSRKLFGEFVFNYSISQTDKATKLTCAMCSDERTINYEGISASELPFGYDMIFLLFSDYFTGKSNASRDKIKLDALEMEHIKIVFIDLVSKALKKEIPTIEDENRKTRERIQASYPQLEGYINDSSIGIVDKNNVINEAQSKFFKAQKSILEAASLDDEQYAKSLDFSSRILTEYILYRQKIIQKLKDIRAKNLECDIHNLIVPKNTKYVQAKMPSDIYTNNAWVLDDKFMSYSVVLSDKQMEEIYPELGVKPSHQYTEKDSGKPDLTLIFSNDPNVNDYFDVVIIEFKRLGLKLAEKEGATSQLRQRARRLLEFYPQKIQRLWFYAIVDMDDEYRSSLKEDKYVKLFSNGEVYYKSQDIVVDKRTQESKLADIFVFEYETMLRDAETRNNTFLNILKEGIRKACGRKNAINKET